MNQTVEERRRYVEQVKASFGSESGVKKDPMDFDTTDEEANFSFFKIKIFIAFLIFVAFVYCDQFNISYKNYKTNTVIEKLQETIPVDHVIKSIENMI